MVDVIILRGDRGCCCDNFGLSGWIKVGCGGFEGEIEDVVWEMWGAMAGNVVAGRDLRIFWGFGGMLVDIY